jgi:hypothetical protein
VVESALEISTPGACAKLSWRMCEIAALLLSDLGLALNLRAHYPDCYRFLFN